MDITNEQIIKEFKRSVKMCSGIGEEEMLKIVKEYFEQEKQVCTSCFVNTSKQIGNMYICPDCGAEVP